MEQLGKKAREALANLRRNLATMERRARVLIIDDDQTDCMLLEKDVRGARPSAVIDFAHNKQQADQLCTEHCYDVIFMDLLMPGASGVDMLKSSPCFEHGEGHLIVLTGLDTDSKLVQEAIQNGARVIFRKPISDRELNLIFGRIP